MTDSEISSLEEQAWASAEGTCGREAILTLTAELRQVKAERDWLAKLAANNIPTINDFVRATQGWLDAAKEATCQK